MLWWESHLSCLRVRTLLYPLLLGVIGIAFIAVLSTKYAFDARLIRGAGNPFHRAADATIVNNFRLRLTNRTDDPRQYEFSVVKPAGSGQPVGRRQTDSAGTKCDATDSSHSPGPCFRIQSDWPIRG